ncbi:MAG: phage tail tube protein [Bacteroides thetaiotaomicron]
MTPVFFNGMFGLGDNMVYVLREAWLSGEASFNAEEGTADLEFHGKTGFFQ